MLVTEKKTWNDAREHCLEMGARLIEIRNRKEYETALRLHEQTSGYTWVGGTDIKLEGQWVWDSNGESVSLNEFWSSGRPLPDKSDLDCLVLLSLGMLDFQCTGFHSFVCEFSKFVRVGVSVIGRFLDTFFQETFCFSANG